MRRRIALAAVVSCLFDSPRAGPSRDVVAHLRGPRLGLEDVGLAGAFGVLSRLTVERFVLDHDVRGHASLTDLAISLCILSRGFPLALAVPGGPRRRVGLVAGR